MLVIGMVGFHAAGEYLQWQRDGDWGIHVGEALI